MAHFFSYDNLKHKHRIYAFEVKNEEGELLGFRPVVHRFDAKKGGIVETISDKYPAVQYAVFSTEDLARNFAINYFDKLEFEL